MVCYYVQMSGVPGSGKSTIARELASRIPAVVLDHDDTKTAILKSGVSPQMAGRASYDVVKTLSSKILEQGFSVIIDSPCLYSELLEHGTRAASAFGAMFKYVECGLSDLVELESRLQSRDTKPSQIQSLSQMFSHAGAEPRPARELVKEWAVKVARPANGGLQLDTTFPLTTCVAQAMEYIAATDGR